MENFNKTQQNYTVGTDISNATDMTSNGSSPVTNMLINDGAASEYDMPQPGEMSRDDYAYYRGRNREYYPDPTYHSVRQNYDRRDRGPYKPKDTVPVYFSTKSKRHELVGIIMRLCDIAGFELPERIVLKDKETGEVLR